MRWLFIFFSLPVFAAYIGNPASPGVMRTGIFSGGNPFIKATSGYVGDFTSNKNYEAEQTEPNFNPNDTFKKFGVDSQMATVSLILLERLELFGYVGGSKERAKLKAEPTLSDSMDLLFDFKSSYHFSWSTGAKVILIQWGQTFLCGDFTYFTVPTSSNSFFEYFNRLNLQMVEKQEFYLEEWQGSGALASRFAMFTPYIGGYYLNSKLHVESGPETGTINYKNSEKWGWFYGITLSLTGRFHLNFESRLKAETAYGFSTIAVF